MSGAVNPRRGAVEITIGAKAFVFVPTMARIAIAEARLGCGIAGWKERLANASTGDFLALAVALCADETLGDVALGADQPAIVEAVFKALSYGHDAGNGGAGAAPAA